MKNKQNRWIRRDEKYEDMDLWISSPNDAEKKELKRRS